MEYTIQKMREPLRDTMGDQKLALTCTAVVGLMSMVWGMVLVARYFIHEENLPLSALLSSLGLFVIGCLILCAMAVIAITMKLQASGMRG